jgi:hypothetical protein
LGKKEVLDLINTIEPITSPVEEADGPPFGMPGKNKLNPWMDEVDGTDAYKVDNWTCDYDYPGILIWSYKNVPFSKLAVKATPDWLGSGTTPIQIDIDEEVQGEMTLKQSEFEDFNEYATAMKPYLNKIEDLESNWGSLAPSNDSMDTDDSVNPFPSMVGEEVGVSTSGQKEEGWSEEQERYDTMMNLAHEYFLKVSPIVISTINAFKKRGFNDQEIIDFLSTDWKNK